MNATDRRSPMAISSAPPDRRRDLDAIRIFVVLVGLIVLHSAVPFISTDGWFVNDAHPNVGFAIFATWAGTWGMPLLMMVSGMGAWYALRRRSAAGFVRERIMRLGVPLAIGFFVLVPPMWYVQQLRQADFHESYWHFWLRFFDLPAIIWGTAKRAEWSSSGGIVLDPAHTWFLYVLLVWSMVLLPLFLCLRTAGGVRLVDRLGRLAERNPVIALGALAVPPILAEAAFGANDNTGMWDRFPYGFFLLYGFLIAMDGRLESVMRRERHLALAAALPMSLLLIFWAGQIDASGGELMNGSQVAWSGLQALTGWLWIVVIFGYSSALGQRRSGKRSAGASRAHPRRARLVERYSEEAALPFYVLHLPVVVFAAWFAVRWHTSVAVKYTAVVIVSFVLTIALYELVRRFRTTRFMFGMKAVPRSRPPVEMTTAPRSEAA